MNPDPDLNVFSKPANGQTPIVPNQPTGSGQLPPQPILFAADAPATPEVVNSQTVSTADDGLPTPVVNSMTPSGPMPNFKSKGSKKKLVFLTVLAGLLLSGGGVGAYYGYIVPNQPNRVITTALNNLVSEKPTGGFALDVSFKDKSSASSSTSFSVKGSVNEDSNSRFDLSMKFSAINLTASTVLRPKDNRLYFKINEVPSLLKLAGSGSLNPALDSFADKLDKNWIEVDTNTLLSDQSVEETSLIPRACVDAVRIYGTAIRAKLKTDLKDTYTKHQFLTAKKLGKETVNDTSTTKYSLDLNQSTAQAFADDLGLTKGKEVDAVSKACGSSTSSDDSSKADTKIDANTYRNILAWVDKNKNIVKVSLEIDEKDAITQVVIQMTKDKLDASKPENSVTLDSLTNDYMQLLGGSADPASLNSLLTN